MTEKLSPLDTVVTGVVRYRDLAYVSILDDENLPNTEYTLLYGWDLTMEGGPWGAWTLQWPTASMTVSLHPVEQACVVSPYGDAFFVGSHLENEERICTPDSDPLDRGHIRHVRTIGDRTFAVGMGRQVYRREDLGQWTCLDQAIRPAIGETKGFESIDGFSTSDLYAVGWDGEIWHYDGSTWSQKNSSTDRVLTGVLCTEEGVVYAWGRRGLLLRGRGDDWEHVTGEDFIWSISDLCAFEGELYVATASDLYRLEGRTLTALTEVDFGGEKPGAFDKLSARNGMLWSMAGKCIYALEDGIWRRIE